MTIHRFVCILFVTFLPGLLVASAQTPQSASPSAASVIKLNVVVAAKSGQPVPGLSQQDFTILDNKSQRPITSFKVVSATEEPVQVILFIDAVNTPFQMVAYMRESVEKFLQAKEGALAYPTAIALLTDKGAQISNGFSTNGIALSDELAHQTIGLREINRSSEWSGDERMQICLNAFDQLLVFASTLHGRKIVLWISPGWPLLSGPRTLLSSKQEQRIFDTVVSFSTRMRQANVTLYNINPVGVQESLLQADYYRTFLKGAAKPGDVQPGDLGIQVLAIQSGGLALESSSDVTGNIQKCLTDVQSWYEIAFDPPPADKPDQYHHIEIKLDGHGLIARTRDGYYANPQLLGQSRIDQAQ